MVVMDLKIHRIRSNPFTPTKHNWSILRELMYLPLPLLRCPNRSRNRNFTGTRKFECKIYGVALF